MREIPFIKIMGHTLSIAGLRHWRSLHTNALSIVRISNYFELKKKKTGGIGCADTVTNTQLFHIPDPHMSC